MENERELQPCLYEGIAAEMDCRGLKYCFGWPDLPSLPVRIIDEGAHRAVPHSAKHIQDAQDILDKEDIEGSVSFAYRVPGYVVADEVEDFLTLVVIIDTTLYIDSSGTSRLPQLVIRLRQQFKDSPDTQHTSIEVVDFRAQVRLVSLPIGSGEHDGAILDKWPAIMSCTSEALHSMG